MGPPREWRAQLQASVTKRPEGRWGKGPVTADYLFPFSRSGQTHLRWDAGAEESGVAALKCAVALTGATAPNTTFLVARQGRVSSLTRGSA